MANEDVINVRIDRNNNNSNTNSISIRSDNSLNLNSLNSNSRNTSNTSNTSIISNPLLSRSEENQPFISNGNRINYEGSGILDHSDSD